MSDAQADREPQLRQCQEYVRTHNIQQLVKEAIVQLCIHKPDRPMAFLRDHFERIDLEQAQALLQVTICQSLLLALLHSATILKAALVRAAGGVKYEKLSKSSCPDATTIGPICVKFSPHCF